MLSVESQKNFIFSELDKLDAALDLSTSSFLDELSTDCSLKEGIEEKVKLVDFFETKSWDSTLRFGLYRVVQYCVTRSVKAKVVIETGVLHGLSTSFILQAVDRNGLGRLHSIDLPSTYVGGAVNNDGFFETLPPNEVSGWAIPDYLLKNWSLNVGSSSEHLPQILKTSPCIDFFVHDSEHTFDTMMNEFEMVWEHLTVGGILLADNIDTNCAFFDFCTNKKRVPVVFPPDPDHLQPGQPGIRFGLLKK
jgi:hypothetical protein